MPFQPRTAEEIRLEQMAQVVAQSELTDVEDGGVAHTIIGVTSLQLALIEQRILSLYKSFGFSGTGTDLDDRCEQLPGFEGRLRLSAATGAVMQFRRLTSLTEVVVPAGIIVASDLDPSVLYITTESFTFSIGQLAYPSAGQSGVNVTCLSLGTAGNTAKGTVTTISKTTSSVVISCTNINALTNGSDRETDDSLRARAFNFFASRSQVTASAIKFMVDSFTASDGTKALTSFVVVDPNFPAYAEVIVDDGDGMQGSTDSGPTITGVTTNGQHTFWFQAPACNSPAPIVTIDGVVQTTVEWVFAHESGVAYLHPDSTLLSTPGIPWSVSRYDVYKGFIRECQAAINGLISLPSHTPGWIAAGGRVRVLPPTLQYVEFTALLVVTAGYDFTEVSERVKGAIVAFMRSLPPGKPMLRFALYDAIGEVDGVENFQLEAPGADVYPSTPRTKLYTTTDRISTEA